MKTTTIRALSFASHFLLAFVVVSALMTPAVGIAFWGTKEAKAVVFAVHGTCLALWLVFRLVAWVFRKRLADDDKVVAPRSAFGRFYRFMSASSVKTETFPEGFDMRASKVRLGLRRLALIMVVALVVWLFYCRIGLAILFAPLIVPGLALFYSRLDMADNVITEESYGRGNFGGILNRLLPLLGKAAPIRGGKLTEPCEYRFSTGRPALAFAIAYLIVYAAYLISTPFRPMPLDPPPPELMAKVHPCLLDENGEIRKMETIIAANVRTHDDVMNFITNNTPPELQVFASMIMNDPSCHDAETRQRERAEYQILLDFWFASKTNVLSLTEAGDIDLMRKVRRDVESFVKMSKSAPKPQLGFQAVIPSYAESRKDYVRFIVSFLPLLREHLSIMRGGLLFAADSGGIARLCDDIVLYSSYGMATCPPGSGEILTLTAISMMEKLPLSVLLRTAERFALSDGDVGRIESVLPCCRPEKSYEEYIIQALDREVGLEPDPPPSVESFKSALRELSNEGNSVPFPYLARGFQSSGNNFSHKLQTALWRPCIAVWLGYDVKAQMHTLGAWRKWRAIETATALEADQTKLNPIVADMLSRSLRHAFSRGSLGYGCFSLMCNYDRGAARNLVRANYADRCTMVADVALRLSQLRGEKGRDAASLAEVEEALGWKPEADSDLEVFYEPIPAPEGAAEGTFAYALGLKPKAGCRKAFENTGEAWLVVRNPNFAG
ncbi:MAG: hypothetical protein IJQ73_14205 [Kiritimatiellae bacterium]|nr:hypothetical protein [Kiritimatiellia bacterium]